MVWGGVDPPPATSEQDEGASLVGYSQFPSRTGSLRQLKPAKKKIFVNIINKIPKPARSLAHSLLRVDFFSGTELNKREKLSL